MPRKALQSLEIQNSNRTIQGVRDMKPRRVIHAAVAAILILAGLNATAFVQAQAAPSLQELLTTQYKLSTTGSDSYGFKVIESGTIVALQKGGVIATPFAVENGLNPFQRSCTNTFKGGALTVARMCTMTTERTRYLDRGWKLYVTKIEVNEKQGKVSFSLVECDICNNQAGPLSMRSTVIFQFTPQFLATAEPGQVTDVIDQVFKPDAEATRLAASGQAPAPANAAGPAAVTAMVAPPPPPPPPPPPQQPAPTDTGPTPTVNIGDPPQRVISILGKPQVILPGAAGKQIYKYKDFKVIFVGGKVVEVD